MRTGLTPADNFVWQAVEKIFTAKENSLAFQFALGKEDAAVSQLPAPYRAMWLSLRRKRADVIVHTPTEILVIEVKPYLRMAALGQALSYRLLWEKEQGTGLPSVPCVVYAVGDSDVTYCADLLGVRLFQSPVDLESLQDLLDPREAPPEGRAAPPTESA